MFNKIIISIILASALLFPLSAKAAVCIVSGGGGDYCASSTPSTNPADLGCSGTGRTMSTTPTDCNTWLNATKPSTPVTQPSGGGAVTGPLIINSCENGVGPGCDDLNVVLLQLIKIADFLFKIIGGIAFVAFVYGGLTMILAMGEQEKFKKGTQTLVAAVVGMLIAFGAYLMINFALDALQVSSEFRGITTSETTVPTNTTPPVTNP